MTAWIVLIASVLVVAILLWLAQSVRGQRPVLRWVIFVVVSASALGWLLIWLLRD